MAKVGLIVAALVSLVGASIFVIADPAYAIPTASLTVNASVDGMSMETVNAGQVVTYTVSVSNSGPSDATNTTVSDPLPSGVELGGTVVPLGAYNDATGIWTIGTLEPSESVTLTMVATVTGTGPSYANSASASADNSSSVSSSAIIDVNTSLAVMETVSAGDSVSPTAGRDLTVDAGSDITYQLTASDTGTTMATDVAVSDMLPVAFTLDDTSFLLDNVSISSADLAANGITVSGGVLTWTVASESPGGSDTLSYTETTDAPTSAQSQADAVSISSTQTNAFGDSDPAATATSTYVEVLPAAGLGITVSDGAGSVTPGGTDTYTISLTNSGPSAVTGATVSDALPSGFTATGDTSSVPGVTFSNLGGGEVEWRGIDLANGSGGTFTLSGNVAGALAGGSAFVDLAAIALPAGSVGSNPAPMATDADTVSPSSGTNISLSVYPGDSVSGSSGPTIAVDAGSDVTYQLTASNTGGTTATDVVVSDTLPAAFTLSNTSFLLNNVSLSPGDLAANGISVSGGVLTWTIATEAPGSGATLTYTETTNAPADPQADENSTSISDGTSAVAQVEVLPVASLVITTSDGVSSVTSGGADTYTVGVTNHGPSALAGATLTDILPGAFTLDDTSVLLNNVSISPADLAANGITIGSGVLTWRIADLPPGNNATLSFGGNVGATLSGGSAFVDSATVSLPLGVVDPGSQTTTDTDVVSPSASVSVKVVDSGDLISGTFNPATHYTTGGAAVAGQGLNYVITVSNTGPSAVDNAVLSDLLPLGVSSDSWSTTTTGGATDTAPSGTGNITDNLSLPPGSSMTYLVDAPVSTSTSLPLVNAPTLTDNTPGPSDLIERATDLVQVQALPALVSSVSAGSILLGSTVTDTVRLTGNENDGTPTGSVAFYVCRTGTTATLSPGVCTASGTPEDAGENLIAAGNDAGATSAPFAPPSLGTWCFSVVAALSSEYYSAGPAGSDNTVISNADPNECVLVASVGIGGAAGGTGGGTGGAVPSPPLDLTGHDGAITLDWRPPASPGGGPVSSYQVFRFTSATTASLIATVSTTSYVDPDVTPGITYSYYVEAVNQFGASQPSNEVSVTATSPAVPSSVCSSYSGVSAFICALYDYLLARPPDPGGMAAWEAALSSGTSIGQAAYAIATSDEYRSDYVGADYRRFLERPVDGIGLASWLSAFRAGATEGQIDAGILGSVEFYSDAGSTNNGYVHHLYQAVLGRPVDPTGLSHWTASLAAGLSRTQVALGVDESHERHVNLVQSLYRRFLNRSADQTGLAHWVRALDSGVSSEVVLAGVSGSQEFYDDVTGA